LQRLQHFAPLQIAAVADLGCQFISYSPCRPHRSGPRLIADVPGIAFEPPYALSAGEFQRFVAGVPEIIDNLVAGIPNAVSGFRLLFSANPFPGAMRFERVRDDCGGTWYRDAATGREGWLCPALFHYFPTAPEHLYARAEKKE
jgi:hypothetical protein